MRFKSSNNMDLDAYLDTLMKTEKTPRFPFSMYFTEGTKYLNLSQNETALKFLDNAVQHDTTNVSALLKRARCLTALRKYEEAIKDAKNALDLRPESVEAVDLIGQAQYLMGDFEGGYLTYLEGRKMKPVSNCLRLGKQLCKEALDNSMHPSRVIKIDKEDIATIVKTPRDDEKFKTELKHRRSARECFGADMKFIKDLMKDKNLSSVHEICKETVDYIKACERFWGTVKPLHTRTKLPKIVKREAKIPQAAKRQIYMCKAAKRRAKLELDKQRIDDCISEVRKMMDIIESIPKQREKEKMNLRCDAYHLMSLAYKKCGNKHLAFEYLFKELDVAVNFNLRLPKIRAYHQLGEGYQQLGNIPRTFQCFQGIIAGMDSEKMDELEEAEIYDIQQLQEAHKWATNYVSGVKLSLRESILSPVVDPIAEYSHEMQVKKSDGSSTENSALDINSKKMDGEDSSLTSSERRLSK